MLTAEQSEKVYRLTRVGVLATVLTIWVLLAIAALTSHFGVPRAFLTVAGVYTVISGALLLCLKRSVQRRAARAGATH